MPEKNAAAPPRETTNGPAAKEEHDDILVPVGSVIRHVRRVLAVVMTLLGVYLAHEGTEIGFNTGDEPGAGFFPFWVGCVLAVLSSGWLINELRRPADAPSQNLEPRGPLRVLGLIGAMAMLTVTFEPLGYNLSVLLFFLALSFAAGRGHTIAKVLVGLGASFGVYLAFAYGLGITLPGSVIPLLYTWGL